jgi:sporulation protein YqfC
MFHDLTSEESMKGMAKTSLCAHRITTKEVSLVKQRENWFQRLADEVDTYSEPLPSLPILELAGDRRLLIENHQGVITYDKENVIIKVQYGTVTVSGGNLEIMHMSKEQVVICGEIANISLHRRERC